MDDKDIERLKGELGELPEPVARPVLIVISGLPGTGKSYFSLKLRERLPCAIVESDAVRKTLSPTPSYSAQENYRLFQACHLLIEELLKKGISVILDATNLIEHHRERLYRIADLLRLKLIIVRVEAPAELVRQRLQDRQETPLRQDRSDADWGVYQRMRPKVQHIRRNHFAVDTSKDITPVLDKIVRAAKRP